MIKIDRSVKRNARALSMLGQSGAILGSELLNLASNNDRHFFVTTADYGNPAGASRFKNLHPNNYINCGIAEQNMIGVAAGIASTGSISLAVAQACFLTMRSFEPIRQYCGYMKLPIILIGVSSGFALQFFGNSHYSLEDVALMRLIPDMNIYTPSDALSAVHCFQMAANSQKPSYIRCTGGVRLPILYKCLDELNGSFATHFTGSDVAVLSSGALTSNAIDAVKDLDYADKATVYDLFELTGLSEGFFEALSDFRKIIVIEEHETKNGVGDLVQKRMANYKKDIIQSSIPVFGHRVGTREFLLEQHGLDIEGIKNLIEMRV